MGSCYKTKRFPFCSREELGRHFADLQARDREEFGWEPYSGSWATIHGLSIEGNRRFTSFADADEYLIDVDKGSAVAVVVVLAMPSAIALRKAEAVRAKARKVEREHLYPLTGQSVSASAYVSPPSWEALIATAILDRVRTAKSRTKGCEGCGSSIAVSHIHRLACPVCGADFLTTESDRRRRESLHSRIARVEEKVGALVTQAKRIEQDGCTPGTEENRYWYIGGVAAE